MDFWATFADLQSGMWQATLAPSSERLQLSRKGDLEGLGTRQLVSRAACGRNPADGWCALFLGPLHASLLLRAFRGSLPFLLSVTFKGISHLCAVPPLSSVDPSGCRILGRQAGRG